MNTETYFRTFTFQAVLNGLFVGKPVKVRTRVPSYPSRRSATNLINQLREQVARENPVTNTGWTLIDSVVS